MCIISVFKMKKMYTLCRNVQHIDRMKYREYVIICIYVKVHYPPLYSFGQATP